MRAVYLIRAGSTNRYKIGTSRNPQKRRRQLQTGSSRRLVLVAYSYHSGANQWESYLHRSFKQYRLRGEWFELPKDEAKYLTGLIGGLGKEEQIATLVDAFEEVIDSEEFSSKERALLFAAYGAVCAIDDTFDNDLDAILQALLDCGQLGPTFTKQVEHHIQSANDEQS